MQSFTTNLGGFDATADSHHDPHAAALLAQVALKAVVKQNIWKQNFPLEKPTNCNGSEPHLPVCFSNKLSLCLRTGRTDAQSLLSRFNPRSRVGG